MGRSRSSWTLLSGLTDRQRRVRVLGVVIVVCALFLGVQAVTADDLSAVSDNSSTPQETSAQDATSFERITEPGNTLITVQEYGWFGNDNGEAFIVDENGTTVWRYDPPNSRVFDAEVTDNRTILVSVATKLDVSGCPAEYSDGGHCVRNQVLEIDPTTNDVVWRYEWYDAFISHHEVHDADRLPSGETAIIDMGNNRAFTVDRAGTVTWSWNAKTYLGEGSAFRQRYGGPERSGPESDWTHMNDIDRLPNGNFLLSIRNFDTVLEVDPETNEIVTTVGQPGATTVLNDQHNPQYLGNDTLLVADSSNNRVVEIDTSTDDVVWTYDASNTERGLQWPRDADRLPNGNTLVTDSRNFRVLEVNESGAIVWRYSMRDERGIAYEADRLGSPEESRGVSPYRDGNGGTTLANPVEETFLWIESWAGFVFPGWVRFPELFALLVGSVAVVWLTGELLADQMRA